MDWRDVFHQLGRLCEEIGLKPQLEKKETEKKERASYSSIHRALLTGLLTHIGLFDERKRYKGVRQRQFRIFPGSGLAAKTPAWIVAAELVETRELYARTVASVQQAWVLKAAAHLLQRSHSDPFFDAKRGEVMAYERSTLYGLVLNERHAVPYGRINPQHARQIFIDEVLIHGRSQSMPGLLKKNQRAQKEARDIANRLRRPDALIDEEVLAEHYDKLLPTAMSAVPQLRRFLAGLDKTASDALLLDAYSMLRDVSLDGMRQDFPDTINYGGNEFAVSYAFDPASEKDGIHVSVPAPLRTLIPDTAFDNLVPGYFEEKCIALMKTLPKQLRKQLLPYPASFASLRPALERQEGGLLQRLETAIEKQFSLRIKREDWQPEKLPAWLTATVNVQEDEAAKAQETATLAATDHYFFLDTFDGRQVTADNYPDLPEQYRYKRSGLEYSAFPGLCQLESGIHLCLYHDQAYGRLHSAMAAAELARQNLSALLNGLRRRLVQGNAQKLHLSTIPEREQFLADFVMRIGVEACGIFEQAPIDAASLMAALKRGKAELGQQEQEWKLFLERLLLQHYNLAMALKDVNKSQYSRLFDDVANLREALLCKGFMMRTPKQWLWHYPRYLQAAAYRVERHRQQGGRDAQLQDKLDVWQQRLQAMPLGKAEQRLFWMLQEYRVSLFAQQLKTSIPVSETRLRQLWEGAQD
jgi:ATP-dependent helicase HrpA